MKNKSRKAPLLASGVLAGMLLASSPAHAELIAYEGFNYTSGTDIRGQSGGSGWAAGSSWSGYDPSLTWPGTVTSSGLSYGSLATQGNALTTATTPGGTVSSSAIYWRNLPQFGQEGTTQYVSFLFRPEVGFGYYGGVNLTNDAGYGIYVGKSGKAGSDTNYGLEGPLNAIDSSSVLVTAGETAFIVLKSQFLAGNDIYSIFVNPALDGVEPGVASAVKTNFDPVPGSPLVGTTFQFNNYGYYTIDEIRVGTTYADVMPTAVPEPTTLSLLAVGFAALAGRTRLIRPAATHD